MKRLMLFAVLAMSFVFYGCGDDDPDAEITGLQSHLDERFDNIQNEIDTLREDVELLAAGAKTPLSDGVIPPDTRKYPEVIKEETGGLPLSGEPTGEPVDDPFAGVPVSGEGKIAFRVANIKADKKNNGAYLMDATGAGKIQISEIAMNPPALSPDGENVAYTAGSLVGEMPTLILHIESGRVLQLTEGDGLDPAWSPDSTKLVFQVNVPGDINGDIATINADGTGFTNLTNSPAREMTPDWQ